MPKPSCALLPSLSIVAVSGRDARSFLQGQLTNDLLGLERHPGLLAASCSREGRVLEILRLAARADSVLLLVRQSLASQMIARLSQYVLRAEVAIEDRSRELAAAGLIGQLPADSWSPAQAAAAGITLMVAGARRLLLAAPPASLQLIQQDCATAAADDWDRAGIEAGEATVYPETAGNWTPQMLNLDLLSAVSFTKGCYVGQEIVARTQHLGRIKRRMLRFIGPAGASFQPGQALYSGSAQAAQVVAASAGPGAVELLAVTDLRYCSELLGAQSGGSELVPADLPYSIPALAAPTQED